MSIDAPKRVTLKAELSRNCNYATEAKKATYVVRYYHHVTIIQSLQTRSESPCVKTMAPIIGFCLLWREFYITGYGT